MGVPRDFAVAGEGSQVLFLRSSGPNDPVNALWALDTSTGAERVVVDPRELAKDVDGEIPAAERARRERVRESAAGITSYTTSNAGLKAAFPLGGELFVADLANETCLTVESSTGAFDPRLSPDGALVAFVVDNSLWVAPTDGSTPAERLVVEDIDGVSWGSAEFVAAEEMRRNRGHWWDPTSQKLAIARVDLTNVNVWHISAPNEPTDTPRAISYPAAGTNNADVKMYVVDVSDSSQIEIDWDRQSYPYLVDVTWGDNEPLTLTVQTRDQRSMKILEVQADTGETVTVAEIADPDWVEIVPGTPRRWRDGWLTIQEHGATRALLHNGTPISPPDQWVRSVVDLEEDRITYTASEDPTTIELWSYDQDGNKLHSDGDGVTFANGSHSVLVTQRSSMQHPATTTVGKGDDLWVIDSLAATPLVEPDVRFHQTGHLQSHTAVVLPTDDFEHPLPILLDPYGGPHAQRVMKSRNSYLLSQWFANQGFCVVITDGPGTPGRGNGWERMIRGDVATPILQAQIEALQTVGELYSDQVDPSRVGIRGWSFGGYLAALAVIRRPDLFHAAVAGAPVTDWRLYDTHYTERYLGHPDLEPDNYKNTSLLEEAENLQRPLMLIHGLADDNVVAAHTLQLSAALLAAGRPHEVLPLSNTTHMTPQEEVAENILLLQVDFLKRNLGTTPVSAGI